LSLLGALGRTPLPGLIGECTRGRHQQDGQRNQLKGAHVERTSNGAAIVDREIPERNRCPFAHAAAAVLPPSST
jgi:hypothetical protein